MRRKGMQVKGMNPQLRLNYLSTQPPRPNSCSPYLLVSDVGRIRASWVQFCKCSSVAKSSVQRWLHLKKMYSGSYRLQTLFWLCITNRFSTDALSIDDFKELTERKFPVLALNHQQDANELICRMMDLILTKIELGESSLVDDHFDWKAKRNFECLKCGKETDTGEEPIWSLDVNIPPPEASPGPSDLTDALHNFFSKERIERRCPCTEEWAYSTGNVLEVPSVLLLNLTRFRTETQLVFTQTKITDRVKVPSMIEMKHPLLVSTLATAGGSEKFALRSFVCHRGGNWCGWTLWY